jgi:hypothetical protein
MENSIGILRDALAAHIDAKNIEGAIETIEKLIQKTKYDPSRPSQNNSNDFLKIISAESTRISILDKANHTIMSLLLSAIGGESAFKNKAIYLKIDINNFNRKSNKIVFNSQSF